VPALALVMLVMLVLFRDTALGMLSIWWRNDTYAHGMLVPVMTLWLIWRVRSSIVVLEPRASYLAVLLLAGAGFVWLLGQLAAVNALAQFALTAMLVFAVWAVIGTQVARRIAFPLLFLFFAVPFGDFTQPKLMEWTAQFTVLGLAFDGHTRVQRGAADRDSFRPMVGGRGLQWRSLSHRVGDHRDPVCLSDVPILEAATDFYRRFHPGAHRCQLATRLHDRDARPSIGQQARGRSRPSDLRLGVFRHRHPGHVLDRCALARGRAAGGSSAVVGQRAYRSSAFLVVAGRRGERAGGRALATRAVAGSAGFGAAVAAVAAARRDFRLAAAEWSASGARDWQPRFENPAASTQAAFAQDGRVVGLYLAYYRNQDQQSKLVSSTNVLVTSDDPHWARVSGGMRDISFNQQALKVRTAQLRASSASVGLVVWQWYWVNGRWTSSDVLAKAYTALSQLTGKGDDSAVIIVYTPQDQAGQAAAALDDFARAAGPALETVLRQALETR
jgi:EpsI family protein